MPKVILGRPATAFQDLVNGARMSQIWIGLATEDVVQRYRYSYLGIVWLLLSYAMFVLAISAIFSGMSGRYDGPDFFVYVATGIWAWFFISAAVNEGAMSMINGISFVKGASLPLSVLFFRVIARLVFSLMVTSLAMFGMLIYHGAFLSILPFHFALGIAIVVLTAFSSTMFLSGICLKIQDIGHLIQSVMRLAFFATPIFWDYTARGGLRGHIAVYNPFTYFLEVVRAPLMGQVPSMMAYGVTLSVMVFLMIAGFIVFALVRRRAPLIG